VTAREQYRGRRVLVFGASGFIGRAVARALADAGAELFSAVRRAGGAREVPGVLTEADLRGKGAAAESIRQVRPEVTFNLAGYGINPRETDPEQAQRLNHDLLSELAGACAAYRQAAWPGQHLVHTGSAAEYGAARSDLAEDTEALPTTLYGRTKLGGTLALRSASSTGALRGATARLFTVYGPGERAGRLLPTLIAARETRGEIPLTEGSQRRDFTYLDDVVEGLLRLGVLPDPGLGPVNLATGKLESVRGFVLRAAAVLGLDPERLRFGALPGRPAEMEHDPVNVGRMRALCGWVPATTLEAGIRQALHAS